MHRRDVPKALLASAAGSLLVAQQARAQTGTPPYYPRTDAEIAAGITPIHYEYEAGNVLRYGADPTGVQDSTPAFNAALASIGGATHLFYSTHYAFADGGEFRIDGTVTIPTGRSLFLRGQVKLIRKAISSNTACVVHIKGNYSVFDAGGGSVWSENASPDGVIACGHLDRTSSAYTAIRWRFANCRVYTKDYGKRNASPYPGATDGIGVYVPSSQPAFTSDTYANFFGTCENIAVENATTAYMLTDTANGHVFLNCTLRGFYHYGFRLHGAMGNVFHGGYIEDGYKDGVIAFLLSNKLVSAASHDSSRNHISGFTFESVGVNQVGIRCEANCQYNRGDIAFNAFGYPIVDMDGANHFSSDAALYTNKKLVFSDLKNCANDAAAASAGTPVGGLYHTNGAVRVRMT
jgi:hypothetical protein